VPESSSPNVKNKSHTITVDVEIPTGGADGVLVAAGGNVGSYTLFVKDGKPTYEYNYFTVERFKIASKDRLTPGKHTIRFEFKYDGGGVGKGGTGTLLADGKEVAKGRIEKTILGRFSADETFDTGEDTGSPVSDLYKAPFRFAGTIKKVEIDLSPEKLAAADLEKIKKAEERFRLAE
jgi:arylsulfatase